MKTLICILLVAVLGVGCGSDDPSFESAAGVWTYDTPDGKIGVDFELVKNGSAWSVVKPVIRVEGTAYNAEVIATGVSDNSIGSLRINANDAKAVYAYYIQFTNGGISGDFSKIQVPDVAYTWPHTKVNNLTGITITRK